MIIAPAHPAPVAPARVPMSAQLAPAPAAGLPAQAPAGGAPVAAAAAGAAALSTPIVDFPGVAAGDRFDIVRGSKVGFIGVRGSAEVLDFTDDLAVFHVRAGTFGVKVDVELTIERIDDDRVRIVSRGSGIPDSEAEGEIVESRENYTRFRDVGGEFDDTVISRDAASGRIRVEAEVPTFGAARLVLDPA